MKGRSKKPRIICCKIKGKPYYAIQYYNVFDGEIHIGYGSYNKKIVKKWLREEFVIVPRLDLEEYSIKELKEATPNA